MPLRILMSLQSLEGDNYLSVLEKVMGKVLVGVIKGGLEGKESCVQLSILVCLRSENA